MSELYICCRPSRNIDGRKEGISIRCFLLAVIPPFSSHSNTASICLAFSVTIPSFFPLPFQVIGAPNTCTSFDLPLIFGERRGEKRRSRPQETRRRGRQEEEGVAKEEEGTWIGGCMHSESSIQVLFSADEQRRSLLGLGCSVSSSHPSPPTDVLHSFSSSSSSFPLSIFPPSSCLLSAQCVGAAVQTEPPLNKSLCFVTSFSCQRTPYNEFGICFLRPA